MIHFYFVSHLYFKSINLHIKEKLLICICKNDINIPLQIFSCIIKFTSCYHKSISSYYHQFIISYYRQFIISYYHQFIISYYHQFIISYYHQFIISYYHQFIISYYRQFIISYYHQFIISYYHQFIILSKNSSYSFKLMLLKLWTSFNLEKLIKPKFD